MPIKSAAATAQAPPARFMTLRLVASADPLQTVGQAIDGTIPVVRDQHRAVFHHLHVDWPADIFVVLQKAGDEGLDRLHRSVGVELRYDDVTTDLLGLVPRAVAYDEEGVVVFAREHVPRVETQAERRRMRPQLRHDLGNSLQLWPQPHCGSGISPPSQ